MRWILLCVSFLGILFFGLVVQKQESRPLYFTPPIALKYFSLGYKDFWANIWWLRLIQSADFCSFEKGHTTYTGTIHHCNLGWSYRITDLITSLAPRFKEPYLFSAVMLSVFTGDTKGADRILQKGLKQFPQDWRLPFYSTYFYSVELNQWEKASHYAHLSAKNGGPKWLYDFSHQAPKKASQVQEAIKQDLLKRKLTKKQKKYIQKKWHTTSKLLFAF